MRTGKRVATTISMSLLSLFAAMPAWAQPYPPQPPGPGVGAGGEGAGAGAAGAAGAGAGGIAFTGADIMVGLVILAGLIVIGWAALAAGRRRARATTS
jgi:hypothetical protein